MKKLFKIPGRQALRMALESLQKPEPDFKRASVYIFLADEQVFKPTLLFRIAQVTCSTHEKQAQLLDHLIVSIKELLQNYD